MFKKINKNTVAAQVIDQITKLIKDGKIKLGDRLPAERAMANQLGVSRPPLREALRALEYAGVIETKQSDGIYVVNNAPILDDNPYFTKLLNQYSLEEMVEMRKIVELAAVKIAVKKADDDDINVLKEIQETAKKNIKNIEAFIECDFEFHNSIAEITGNSLLHNVVKTMRKLITVFNKELFVDNNNLTQDVYQMHQEILECIEKKDEKNAEKAMEKHLDNVIKQAKKINNIHKK